MRWLEETYPDLVPKYKAMYTKAYASPRERKSFGARVAALISSLGPPQLRTRKAVDHRRRNRFKQARESVESEQLTLL